MRPKLVTRALRIRARRSLQLRVYDIAKQQDGETGHESGHVELIHFVRNKTPKVEIRSHFVTPANRAETARIGRYVKTMVEAGFFPQCDPDPPGNWNYCSARFCSYWSKCRGADVPAPVEGERDV